MNYRHGFHAGNFADVLKHLVLHYLVGAMQRKDKPFLYLDTHAGRGMYDLKGPEAQQTQEWKAGIARLQSLTNAPDPIASFSRLMDQFNRERGQTDWRYYPGSPEIVARQLRLQDRGVFCELNDSEAKALGHYLSHFSRTHVHTGDGYHALKAYLPAPEKRALVLIDPPYEHDSDDFRHIVNAIVEAQRRMATAVIALWYPIKTEHATQALYRAIEKSGIRDVACIELSVFDGVANVGLNGSGMIVIHPPYQMLAHMHSMLPMLWQALSPQRHGSYKALMLAEE